MLEVLRVLGCLQDQKINSTSFSANSIPTSGRGKKSPQNPCSRNAWVALVQKIFQLNLALSLGGVSPTSNSLLSIDERNFQVF